MSAIYSSLLACNVYLKFQLFIISVKINFFSFFFSTKLIRHFRIQTSGQILFSKSIKFREIFVLPYFFSNYEICTAQWRIFETIGKLKIYYCEPEPRREIPQKRWNRINILGLIQETKYGKLFNQLLLIHSIPWVDL